MDAALVSHKGQKVSNVTMYHLLNEVYKKKTRPINF